MTYEMYRYVFLGAAVACGIFFAISAVLFFVLRIPKVISDLTGVILVVLGAVNPFQGLLVPISLRPVLKIVAAYVQGTVWSSCS